MRLAVDVGGTFTDLVLFDEQTGATRTVKCPSTPGRFEDGVLAAVDEVRPRLQDPGTVAFIHGSTVVINHLLERKGAKTALITTKGFRDNLDIQRTNRPDLYNLRYRKPKPFVERKDRYEVDERIGPRGEVIRPLNVAELSEVVDHLREGRYEAVAIAFLHAYRNPAHELQCMEYIREHLPGVFVACSSQVELWREYERTNTTVCCAYVGPSVADYLQRLANGLTARDIGRSRPLTMMLSSGGRTTFQEASRWPIDLIESGPAAGVTGARRVARWCGIQNFIALDVGGTTAKAALVEDGEPERVQEYILEPGPRSGGYPLLVPSLDIKEIGAGGGSIVRVSEDGAIQVGPDSAGAMPGPACYGRGGRLPTITDANFLAGRLPEVLASGLRLDRDRARAAFAPLAERLRMPLEDVVRGVLRVAEAKMARVVHLATVARGKDPRDYDLIAYGGSAPLHAVALARELRIRRVVIPPAAGVFAAWGMIHAPYQVDRMKTVNAPWPEGRAEVESVCAALRDDAVSKIQSMGRRAGHARVYLEVRYVGQARSLTVEADDADLVHMRFTKAHREKYGFTLDAPLEVTGVHVVVTDQDETSESGTFGAKVQPRGQEQAGAAAIGMRQVLTHDGWRKAPVYRREALAAGAVVTGPAVVEEETTTTYVPPEAVLTVDAYANMIIQVGG
ncbi:hydantoinase/oxoprolinase family protein [Alicyclobacillus macrosporangiidus]|uniref:hydantoinase/oxoprolinase family protein n=1 Tax=Alicyclobacillus macrosporangiidus TaxID=392015 RepID=UPI000495C3CE|nr:hydantoinase/oxoprolinase family protein [Alicyclobacillus macrosporangiidus]